MSFRNVDSIFCSHMKDRVHQGDILKNIKFIQIKNLPEEKNIDYDSYEFPYIIILSQECDLKWDSENHIDLEILEEVKAIHDDYSCLNEKDNCDKLKPIFFKLINISKKLRKPLENYSLKNEDFSIRDQDLQNTKKYINKIDNIILNLTKTINSDKCLPNILICPAYLATDFFKGNHIANKKMSNMDSKDKLLKKNNEFKRYHFISAGEKTPDLVIDFKHFFTLPREYLYSLYNDHYLYSLNVIFNESLAQRFSFFLSRIGLPEGHNSE